MHEDWIESLLGSRVEVRWEKSWYPAILLRIEDGHGLVEYIGDFPDELIPFSRIRAPMSSPKNIIPSNGSFNTSLFKEYVKHYNKNCSDMSFITELQSENLMALISSVHANERKAERFASYLQEFNRSMVTKVDKIVVTYARQCILLPSSRKIIEFSADFSCICNVRDLKEKDSSWKFGKEGVSLCTPSLREIKKLIDRWNSSQKEYERQILAANGPDNTLTEEEEDELLNVALRNTRECVTVKIVTTRVTLLVSSDFRKLITCYENKKGFGEWQILQHKKKVRALKRH